MTKKTANKIAVRARKLFRVQNETKGNYAVMDKLAKDIRALGMKPGEAVVINARGDKAVLKDVHENDDKVFRTHCCSRYELQLEKAAS